jgi:hypothetical protein
MQIFLLIVIFILIVINLKQADELRDLERKTLDDSQWCTAGGRGRSADEQEEITNNAKRAKRAV